MLVAITWTTGRLYVIGNNGTTNLIGDPVDPAKVKSTHKLVELRLVEERIKPAKEQNDARIKALQLLDALFKRGNPPQMDAVKA